jgi:hypothetical protein
MQVLVYHNQLGPAMVYLAPAGNAAPEGASIPGGPFPRAVAQVTSRGHSISWENWCRRLAHSLPYFDSWSVEDVPDGLSAQDVLSVVRSRTSDHLMAGTSPAMDLTPDN